MNVRDLDLNLLRVFDAVLSERGVTPAAARLGLTQPAVSNALARLRALFGDALFVRTASGMDATPFARGVAEPVRQALALLESAWRTARASSRPPRRGRFASTCRTWARLSSCRRWSSACCAPRPGYASRRWPRTS